MSQLYNAAVQGQTALLPPAGSYPDYIHQADRGTAAAYWQQLSLPQWRLPTKGAGAASVEKNRQHLPSYQSAHRAWHLSPERYQQFQIWSRQQGCTPFMTLLAAFCLLLHRWSQAPELMVGISVAGQGQPGRSRLVAHCVNVLPVHSQLQPDLPLADYLHQIRHRLLECYDHADYSLSQWVRWAQGNEGRSHPHAAPPLQPIVPVLFNLDPSLPVPNFQGLAVTAIPQPPIYVRWDLSWHLIEAEGGLHLTAGYRRDCFEEAAIAAWIAEYDVFLSLIVEHADASVERLNQALDDTLRAQVQQVQQMLTLHNRQKLEAANRRQQ